MGTLGLWSVALSWCSHILEAASTQGNPDVAQPTRNHYLVMSSVNVVMISTIINITSIYFILDTSELITDEVLLYRSISIMVCLSFSLRKLFHTWCKTRSKNQCYIGSVHNHFTLTKAPPFTQQRSSNFLAERICVWKKNICKKIMWILMYPAMLCIFNNLGCLLPEI